MSSRIRDHGSTSSSSTRWTVEQHRRERERGHDLFDLSPRPADEPGRPPTTCCSPAVARSRPATSCTARRRCCVYTPATACTASRSILPSARSCSVAPHMQHAPTRGSRIRLTRPTPIAFPNTATVSLHWLKSGEDEPSTRRATSARWSPTFIARCSRGASSCILPRPATRGQPPADVRGQSRRAGWPNRPAESPPMAGGPSSISTQRRLHQRTPLVVGSRYEMDRLHSFRRMKSHL